MKNYDILINPLTTEKSVRLMETENKLTFIVAKNAGKKMIKDAAETLFSVKVKKVNTHNNLGKKIAVVTLHPDFNAMDVATKLGII